MGKTNFNKRSTRAMRRARLQPAYGPGSDLHLAAAAGLPLLVQPAEVEVLNFDCQWCGQPFRARSQAVIPCPLCKSEHGPEDGYSGLSDWHDPGDDGDDWTEADMFALADELGQKVANGQLPPQNEFGQYLI
jgi:hypothetical protein